MWMFSHSMCLQDFWTQFVPLSFLCYAFILSPLNINLTVFIMLCITPSKDHAAAAAGASLQSCATLCDPRDGSPPGSPVPGIHSLANGRSPRGCSILNASMKMHQMYD